MNPEYLGYAICLLFLEDGIEWSVYINEAGVLVTQEPNAKNFNYTDYDEFKQAFPNLAAEVQLIVMKNMIETMTLIQQVQSCR